MLFLLFGFFQFPCELELILVVGNFIEQNFDIQILVIRNYKKKDFLKFSYH